MPEFRTLDIIASQGLLLNILNSSSFIYILYKVFLAKDSTINDLKGISNNLFLVSFFSFFLWSSITSFWSINTSEALRTLSEIFTTIFALFNVITHAKSIKKHGVDFIFFVLLCMQTIEIFFLFKPYLNDIAQEIYRSGSMAYNGVTGNKNIASFSILIKVPILIYFMFSSRVGYYGKLLRLFSYLLLFMSFYGIFFITLTRAAELGFLLLIVFFVLKMTLKNNDPEKNYFDQIKRVTFFLTPLILSLLIGSIFAKNKVSITNNISTAFSQTDSSSNERLRFYKYAFELISDNFFTGTGIGSWEIESIEKDRLEMRSYVVPYHVHNDLLEIFSETGFFGFILFYCPILFLYYKLFRGTLKNKKTENNLKTTVLFLMLSMYLLDALLNFPFARVIQNINLIFIVSVSSLIYLQKRDTVFNFDSIKATKFFLISFLILSPFSLYSSIRLFNSSRDQSMLLYAFNQNNFKLFNDEDLQKMESTYPNLTLTGLPIATILGIHYYYYDDLDTSEKYFRQGLKANPYLNVNQSYIGKVYEKRGMIDSAIAYTKYAFEKMPNNPVHFGHYIQVLSRRNDTIGIKKAYENVMYKDRDDRFEKLYLLAMTNLLDKDEGNLVLNDIKKNQLKSDGLLGSYFILKIGKKRVAEGYINYLQAEEFFKKNDFFNASKFYDLAFESNPFEYPYAENAAISYLRLGKLEIALERINTVIDNMDLDSKNGKAFYIRGLINLEKSEIKMACNDFETSLEFGFNSKTAILSYCK